MLKTVLKKPRLRARLVALGFSRGSPCRKALMERRALAPEVCLATPPGDPTPTHPQSGWSSRFRDVASQDARPHPQIRVSPTNPGAPSIRSFIADGWAPQPQAPKARNIPAWGTPGSSADALCPLGWNAPGDRSDKQPRAESPKHRYKQPRPTPPHTTCTSHISNNSLRYAYKECGSISGSS